MNALQQIRERMGLGPKELAHRLDVSYETVLNQERARTPRRLYVLAAARLEDIQAARSSLTLDTMRQVLHDIQILVDKGVKL